MPSKSPTISETEIDMQKIQLKISALEQNLEKFSSRKLIPVSMEASSASTIGPIQSKETIAKDAAISADRQVPQLPSSKNFNNKY